jgi:hypothetical protein
MHGLLHKKRNKWNSIAEGRHLEIERGQKRF